jgi:hypothetical protein
MAIMGTMLTHLDFFSQQAFGLGGCVFREMDAYQRRNARVCLDTSQVWGWDVVRLSFAPRVRPRRVPWPSRFSTPYELCLTSPLL